MSINWNGNVGGVRTGVGGQRHRHWYNVGLGGTGMARRAGNSHPPPELLGEKSRNPTGGGGQRAGNNQWGAASAVTCPPNGSAARVGAAVGACNSQNKVGTPWSMFGNNRPHNNPHQSAMFNLQFKMLPVAWRRCSGQRRVELNQNGNSYE